MREIEWGQSETSVLKPVAMRWNIHGMNEKAGSVASELMQVGNAGLILSLEYSLNLDGMDRYVCEAIQLQSTRLYSGRLRWWFTCPRVSNGKPCFRRVGKVYLPPGGVYFGCRLCYGLTYMSSQNPDARIEMPEKVRRFLYGL